MVAGGLGMLVCIPTLQLDAHADSGTNVEIPLLLTKLSRTLWQQGACVLALVGLDIDLSIVRANCLVANSSVLQSHVLSSRPNDTGLRRTYWRSLSRNCKEIFTLLQTLNQSQKKTIIMVTHDFKVAEYATRLLFIDKGRFTPD